MDVAKPTVTGDVDTFDNVTVKSMGDVPLFPSATSGSAIEIDGAVAVSSLAMMPVATAWPRVAPEGFDRVMMTVSAGSTVVSPRIPTLIICAVWPAAKVSVPEAAV